VTRAVIITTNERCRPGHSTPRRRSWLIQGLLQHWALWSRETTEDRSYQVVAPPIPTCCPFRLSACRVPTDLNARPNYRRAIWRTPRLSPPSWLVTPLGSLKAYDRYAPPLYAYCRSLLPEPADAGRRRAGHVPRRQRQAAGPAGPGPAPVLALRGGAQRVLPPAAGRVRRCPGSRNAADVPAPSTAIGAATEQAELSQLVRAAVGRAEPARAGRHRAQPGRRARRRRARHRARGIAQPRPRGCCRGRAVQLERSLGALIVARTVRGRLRRPRRHAGRLGRTADRADAQSGSAAISNSATSAGKRKRRELTPALLGGVLADRGPPGRALSRASVISYCTYWPTALPPG